MSRLVCEIEMNSAVLSRIQAISFAVKSPSLRHNVRYYEQDVVVIVESDVESDR